MSWQGIGEIAESVGDLAVETAEAPRALLKRVMAPEGARWFEENDHGEFGESSQREVAEVLAEAAAGAAD